MTPRSIRRAAERKAMKRARKTQFLAPETELKTPALAVPLVDNAPETEATEPPTAPSKARLTANRSNAQLSTGPTSTAGKAKSSLNVVTNALTGRTVLLPADDRDRYQQHVAAFFKEYNPVGARECELAQSLADIWWRLSRIATLEMALFANGRREFEALVENESPEARPSLLDMHTLLHYERQFRNLATQESRLTRQREKQSSELKQLQEDRIKQQREQLEMAARLYLIAKKDCKPCHPEAQRVRIRAAKQKRNSSGFRAARSTPRPFCARSSKEYGFEFSIADLDDYLEGVRAAAVGREIRKTETHAGTTRAAA